PATHLVLPSFPTRRSSDLKVFGLDHYNVAAATVELAALYRTQGRSELAELLYRRALPIEERALGARHPRTARTTAMYADAWPPVDRKSTRLNSSHVSISDS